MALNRQASYWVDAYGATRMTTFNYSASPLTIANDLINASNGGISQFFNGAVTNLAPFPVTVPYQGVQDSALLLFQDSGGSLTKIYLPAPAITIFLADNVTVDPANADVIAIVASVLTYGLSSQGLALVSFLGGTYQRAGRILQNG
jgi:hypothetical protein